MTGRESFQPDFAVVVGASEAPEAAVLEVRGELDSGTCEELLEAFHSAVAAGAKRLTLNLRYTTFIDSAGMRALIMLERAAGERGLSLVLSPAPDHVTELLRTAGVVDHLGRDPKAPPSPVADSGFREQTELELPREPQSPARARAEVRACVSGGDEAQLASLVLLTSELVTNAVVHPRGVGQAPVGLRVIAYDDRVRVEVEDAGDGFARVVAVSSEAERGRGLFLVDKFAKRWGSGRVQTEAGPRFRVWFELDWPGGTPQVA